MEVGVDIIEIDRIAAAAENPRFLERVYTEAERERSLKRKNPAEELAGRFASKEAVIKCLGRRVPWKQIEILAEPSGKPYVVLHGLAKELGCGRRIAISISHSRAFAVASAVMEQGVGGGE
ncbi:MAG: holo-ACP synthase [Armatimonadetes bacterium]|nr:holo-ACP synthase [Armatimonadota bacterium]